MRSPLRAGGRTTGSHGNGGSNFMSRGGALTPLRSLSLQLPVDDISVIISRLYSLCTKEYICSMVL